MTSSENITWTGTYTPNADVEDATNELILGTDWTDTAGNTGFEFTSMNFTIDTAVPVITLLGDATVTIEVGSTYTDAGATATDNYDGDITSSIVTVSTVDADYCRSLHIDL